MGKLYEEILWLNRRRNGGSTSAGMVAQSKTEWWLNLSGLGAQRTPEYSWIKLNKFVPWGEFDLKYAGNFRSKKDQRAYDSRMALGSVLIKIYYKGMSNENLTKEIAINPYLQFFLGLREYRYECPFDTSTMTRFRQRISKEMLAWVNDENHRSENSGREKRRRSQRR